LRRRLRRNQLACLFLAQGVPLLLAGDEVGNSNNGNNNAYCQDNEIGWVDWSKSGTEDDLSTLVGELTKLRCDFPQITSRQWLEGQKADGSYDVKWLTPQAKEMTEADWNLPHARFLSYVLAAADAGGKPLLIVLNGADTPVGITFPEWPGVANWRCLLDTSDGHEHSVTQAPGATWDVQTRCVLAFAGEP
jgi:glycogen operon protein